MASESFSDAEAEAEAAGKHGQKAFEEAVAAAERAITEAARRAERVFRDTDKALRESLDKWREQAKTYGGTAGQSVDDAQKYVFERVKERPVTATVAGLGVGLLLGLLLANRNSR